MARKQLFILLTSCFLSACATSDQDAGEAGLGDSGRRSNCILQGSIRDYQVLDDQTLVVEAGGRRNYVVELSRRAPGLKSAFQLGFSSPSGSVCAGFSEVIVRDSFGPEAIRIASIRELSPEELDTMLIRYGKKKPEIEQDPEPEDVEGAEVEELD